jgi:fructose-specific phosphotransferase system IIA component
MDLKISDILRSSAVLLNQEAKDKTDILVRLVAALAASNEVADGAELQRVILEREKLMSTGIGNGVALPHGKTNVVKTSMAALATLKTPLDFDSLDDKPVSIVLLLVGTESNVGVHLRLLSRVSRMVGNEAFRSALMNATSVDDAVAVFASYEEDRS